MYCKALCKYDGSPEPPSLLKPVLLFEQNELIELVSNFEDKDTEWCHGVRLRTKRFLSEQGYFPRYCVQNIVDVKSELAFYSWYFQGNKELATKILNRIAPYAKSKPVFLVRESSQKQKGYVISFNYSNKVQNITINNNYFSHADLDANKDAECSWFLQKTNIQQEKNQQLASNALYYSIEKRNFLSISELVDFFVNNSLEDSFPGVKTTLGTPYREMLPTPLFTAVSKSDYQPILQNGNGIMHNNSDDPPLMELKKGETYFVFKEVVNRKIFLVFDSDGLIGYVPISAVTINE